MEKYILKDGKGIDTEAIIENQNTSFLNASYCTQENKQPQNGLQKTVKSINIDALSLAVASDSVEAAM